MRGPKQESTFWTELVRQLEGYAFVARCDGQILDANQAGWGFLERWRRERGGWELPAWLLAVEEAHVQGIENEQELDLRLSGGRSYRLRASLVPGSEHDTKGPQFIVQADEVLGRAEVPLRKLRERYHLTQREAEILSLLLSGRSNSEVGRMLGMAPIEAKRIARRVRVKLGEAAGLLHAKPTSDVFSLS